MQMRMSRGRRRHRPSANAGDTPGVGELLVEAISDQHADWSWECREVRRTFTAWARAPLAERARAFADYRLALEREEQASIIDRDLLAESRHLRARQRGSATSELAGEPSVSAPVTAIRPAPAHRAAPRRRSRV